MPEKLFIKIENNQPVKHPVLESNLKSIMPDFNPENPPQGWVPFIRIAPPVANIGNVITSSSVSYDWTSNGEMMFDKWVYTEEVDPTFEWPQEGEPDLETIKNILQGLDGAGAPPR